ncbi:MAG: hypothetical protein RIB45_06840 [Marivibrio sp.]|uniref:hypothetical protein n=1 Tax=Marivibrio sp. TaxID=2039719 RepID=UPI0032ED34BF
MNRDALGMLLRSGRFLCFDSTDIYSALQESDGVGAAMFDNKALNAGILFKEVSQGEDEDELELTTRMYFPYDESNKLDGGESILATAESVQKMMLRRGALKENEQMSSHDQTVLRVFDLVPTFDPFLLLSQRRELETERPIDRRFFDIDEKTWAGIRRPVMHKITVLVSKAGLGAALDEGGKDDGPEAQVSASPGASVANSILNAMWTGEPTPGVKAFISSFRLDVDKTQEILFAWKGINYYEYLNRTMFDDFVGLFKWLGSDESLPRDRMMMDPALIARFQAHRTSSRAHLKQHFERVQQHLRGYNDAFNALIDKDDPAAFQNFLQNAPSTFTDIGSSIGVLAHATNAYVELTKSGAKPTVKADKLQPFYDFVVGLAGRHS